MKSLFSSFVILVLGGIFSLTLSAQSPAITQRLQYSTSLGDVVVSSNQQVVLPSLSSGVVDMGSLFTLTFGVDYSSNVMPVGDKVYEVDVKIEYHASGSSVLQSQYETLVLDGNSGNGTTQLNVGVDKRTVLMDHVRDAKVIVQALRENSVSVSFLNRRLYMDLELYPNLHTALSSTTPSAAVVSCVGVDACSAVGGGDSGEFLVSWTPITGAVEYQLEYVFVNDYGTTIGSYLPMSSLHLDFRHNSTRVTTGETSYRVSNLFDHGYVCFRYRAIGMDVSSGGVVYGPWSMSDGDHAVSDVASLGGTVYGITSGHESGLNWQSTQTYAEGGKKKEVVTYADGSMRSRQVVTRINTTNSVVVGETYYDYQGRAALQILPAPVSDLLGSCGTSGVLRDGLHFYPSFNQAEGGLPITPYLFDRDRSSTELCNSLELRLDSASGAGKYYSANNVRYGSSGLARSEGYGYSRVAYTPDNTGRVREQGGVGEAFQLGSGHTTRSFYGGSSQVELDRLFGSEVGYSEHYRKVLVLDGNGQVSVSYMNQEDKVIATALAGSSPSNLLPLNSPEVTPEELQETLLPASSAEAINNSVSGDGKELSYITTITMSSPSDLVLRYDLSVLPLSDACMDSWCASCVYDLRISVRDDCGSYLGGMSESVVGHVGVDEGGALSFYSDCASYDMNGSGMWELTLSSLPVGSYEVSKVLRVNEAALNHYVSFYSDPANNTCMQTYSDYLSMYMSQIDSSGCMDQTCDACLSSLGNLSDYLSSGRGSAEDYAQEMTFCQSLCGEVSPCSDAFTMLRMDVSPGGQYGQYEGDASTYALSVFNDSNHLSTHLSSGGLDGTWRSPRYYDTSVGGFVAGYYEWAGSAMERSRIAVTSVGGGVYSPQVVSSSSVFLGMDGVYYVYPEQLLLLSDFLFYWRPDWSLSLVFNHPEYAYYESCLAMERGVNGEDGVYVFDGHLSQQSTRDEAVSNGYLSSTGVPTDWFSSTGVLQDYFVSSGAYGVYGSSLQDEWNHYYVNTSLGIDLSMAEFSALSVRGVGYLGATSIPAALYAFGSGSNTTVLNSEWSFLRELYTTRKRHWVSKYMDAQAASGSVSGVNDCIGNSSWVCPSGYLGVYGAGVASCSSLNRSYYVSKVIHFGGDEDVTAMLGSSGVGTDYNTASFHVYEQTGLCPVAASFSQVLQELATSGDLYSSTSVSLQGLGTFAGLYISLHDGSVSSVDPYSNYDWMWNTSLSSLTSSVLTANLYRSSLGVGGGWSGLVTLSKDTCSWSWDEVATLGNFHYLGDSLGYGRFSVEVLVLLPSGLTRVDELQGLTDLFALGGCRFDTECTLSSYGHQLLDVLNAQQGVLSVSGVGTLGGCTSCSSSHALDEVYLPVGMSTWLGSGSVDTSGYYVWYSSSDHSLFIHSVSSTYPRIKLELTGSVSSTGGAGLSFESLPHDAVFKTLACDHEHYFTLAVYAADTLWCSYSGASFIELSSGSLEVAPVCDCGLPVSIGCIGEGYAMERSVGAWMSAAFTMDGSGANYWDRMGQVPTLDATLASTLFLSSSDYGVVGVEQYDSASGVDSLIYDYSSCRMVLWSDGLDGSSTTWSGVHGVFGFHADTSSAVPSLVDSFSFSAVNGNGDTIRVSGYSACLSLERCLSCDTLSTSTGSDPKKRLSLSSSEGAGWSDGAALEYKQYLEALNQYNGYYGYVSGDAGFIEALDYKTFYMQGSKYTLSMYLDKLLFYMGVDTTYDRGVLTDLATFSKEYGNYVDGMKEYEMYSSLMLEYNTKRSLLGLSMLAPEGEMNFLKSSYGAYVKDYSAYLFSEVNGVSGAETLGSWLLGLDSVLPLSESFNLLYSSYVEAYKQWYFTQVTRMNALSEEYCKDYKTRTLYLQEDFEKLGYSSSTGGQAAMQLYITEITQAGETGECISMLKGYDGGSSTTDYSALKSTDKSCQTLYLSYLSGIARYNSSAYAALHIDRQLLDPALSYVDFMSYGLCACVESYLAYLEGYSSYSSSTTGVTPAVGILYFDGCGITLPKGYTESKDCYTLYTDAYYAYNTWAIANGGSVIVGDLVDSKVFVNEDLCSCVDDYAAYLQSIEDGVRKLEEGEKGPKSLLDFCGSGLPGCVVGSDIALSIPVLDSLPYEDPCLSSLVSQAEANAEWAYAQEVDSVSAAFSSAYIAHCIEGASEFFDRRWDDQEYHYTLYYYDQAGNLIKTVPPAGVVRLPITSTSDALSVAIAADRSAGVRSVYTHHEMATHYYYNSLNQLVGQRLPDHEAMDLSSVEDVVGVGYTSSSSGGGSSVQLVDEHVGYGVMDDGTRLYRTQDGGLTWTEDMGVSGADVWDMCLENTGLKGYMVGDGGQVYYTNSGGMQWEEVALPELGEYTQWRGVAMKEPATGVEVVVVGEHRVAYLSGGVWQVDSPLLFSDVWLEKVVSDGSGAYYAVGTSTVVEGGVTYEVGGIYRTTATSPLSWMRVDALPPVSTLSTHYGRVLSSGVGGSLRVGSADGSIRRVVGSRVMSERSGLAGKEVLDVLSLNGAGTEVALLLSSPGVITMQYRASGMDSLWQAVPMAPAGITQLTSLRMLSNGSSQFLGICGGAFNNGKVYLFSYGSQWSVYPINLNTTDSKANQLAVLRKDVSTVVAQPMAYVSTNQHIYYTPNVQAPVSSMVWTKSWVADTYARVALCDLGSGGVLVARLNSAGELTAVRINPNNTETTISIPTSLGSGGGVAWKELLFGKVGTQSYVYLYGVDATGHWKIRRASVSSTTGSLSSVSSLVGVQDDMRLGFGEDKLWLSDNLGRTRYVDFSGATAPTVTYYPQPLRCVSRYATSSVLAAGQDGDVFEVYSSTSTAQQLNTQLTHDIMDLGVIDGAKFFYSSGRNGKLSGSKYLLTSGSSGPISQVLSSNISLPNVGHTCLWSVAGGYSSTAGYSYYVVGSGGRSWYKSASSDAESLPQQMPVTGGASLRSIVRRGSSDVYFTAGANATMRTFSYGSSLSGSRIVPFTMNRVYFSSPSVGMVVGDRSVIRYTLDGGGHWRILKLASGQTRMHKNLLAASCNEVGVGLVGGYVDGLWSVNLSTGTYANTGVSGTSGVGISSISDIYIDATSGKGYAVGKASTTGVALQTTNAGVSFSALSGASAHTGYSSIAPLWASAGSTVMLGCEDGKMYLASSAGVSGSGVDITGSTSQAITDLVFTDAFTCYAVGGSGVLTKGTYVGTASATLPLTYSLTSTDWQWADAVSGGSGTTAQINSIAMRNNHEGVVVGSGAHYVRFLTNYAGVYSQRFWYDKLGRIVLSQNTKQHVNGTYSYSLYDAQGRVQEAGVKEENTSTTGLHMSDVQGADVGGAFNPLAIEVSSTTGSSSGTAFMQWLAQGLNTSTGVNATRTEVTRTVYDEPLVSGIPSFTQNNLRKRVSTVVYQKVYHSDASDGYTHATHYSYDIHGNVNELVQDNPEMAVTSSLSDQQYKHLEYDYDLISGKVNRVSYQRGERDAWHHWYEYDADNRITQVYTSTHPDPMVMAGTMLTDPTVVGALWEQDSKYFYYAHGPLMRQELGSNQVQGVDYAYTLQGWIKGINSNALDATRDMGHDGSGAGLNGRFARDVASFSLSYYEGDFSSVASTGAFSSVVGSDLEAESHDLYNGNIRIMQTTLMENNGSGGLAPSNQGMAYKYDQLNRLRQAKGFKQYAPSTNVWATSSGATGENNNFFTFDANGNIITQQRYEGSTLVDDLTYQYATNSTGDLLSNRLYSVDDAVTNTSLSATDMEDMPAYNNTSPNTSNNYTYTQIGELKSDAQEEIQEIVWRVDSKISEITRTSGSVKKNLKFEYDAMGNRVAKHVYAGSVLEASTYYVRDAQGNVMGVYEHKMDAENAVLEYRLIERNIYGSAQVGICKDTVDLNITNAAGALTQATYYHARQLNHRQYSLSNHLGNVLTTIGDGKAATDSNNDGVIDYYTAYIISVSDYSPFGVELANRSWSIEEYRNGFNTQEKVSEIAPGHTTAMYWEYDARLGRRWQLDPVVKIWESGYATLNNNPIQLSDSRGDDAKDPIKIEVQSGDCLSKIANRYNTTIEAIKNANRSNIDWQKRGDKILAGETLYIPKPSTYSGNYAQTTASFQKWEEDSYNNIPTLYAKLMSSNRESSNGHGNSWMSTMNSINGYVGIGLGVVENSFGKVRVGSNFGIYLPKSNGKVFFSNQFVKTISVRSFAGFCNIFTLGIGTYLDYQGVKIYNTKGPNAVGAVNPGKAYLNLAVGTWSSAVGGVGGLAGSVMYWGIATFYPGGWQGAIQKSDSLIRQNQEVINKNFNLYRDF